MQTEFEDRLKGSPRLTPLDQVLGASNALVEPWWPQGELRLRLGRRSPTISSSRSRSPRPARLARRLGLQSDLTTDAGPYAPARPGGRSRRHGRAASTGCDAVAPLMRWHGATAKRSAFPGCAREGALSVGADAARGATLFMPPAVVTTAGRAARNF